jgi:glycosyltransferase involved in cell wall biosynthesis
MKIVLLTPGTGSYHCGVCMRDNALAKELHRQGHDALMLPMYLPLTLDEDAASPGTPIFFGGVSTYLREKVPWLRHMPRWMDRVLSHRTLLRLVAGKAAARTGGPDVAEMTLSMLRGERGHQAAEIEELIAWLREHARPDAIWLSTGVASRPRTTPQGGTRRPGARFSPGRGFFHRWSRRAVDRTGLVAARRAHARRRWLDRPESLFCRPHGSSHRLERGRPGPMDAGRSQWRGHGWLQRQPRSPRARHRLPRAVYPGKGLGLLVDAFITLKKRGRFPRATLRCAGSMTAADAAYVETLKARLKAAGVDQDVAWLPNVSREEKIAFLESLTVFSVPATYGEAFGLYVIEALAAGVPVVLPNTAAFPELVSATEGGRLFELEATAAESAERLADALESLLGAPAEARALGERPGGGAARVLDQPARRAARVNHARNDRRAQPVH